MKILISAGHTNNPQSDRGAAGNGFIEGVETVKIRDAVAALLRDRGFEVIEDGADGVNDPLKKAIALAKTAEAAVEFHFNASANPSATGVEVLSKSKHKVLAQGIAKEIADALDLNLRRDNGWLSDSGGNHHRLGFCEAGGLIVEVCFISNKADMTAYESNFGAMTIGIANAIGGTAAVSPEIYVVKAGDTLTKIAGLFGTNAVSLKSLNGLTSDNILVGQEIKVR